MGGDIKKSVGRGAPGICTARTPESGLTTADMDCRASLAMTRVVLAMTGTVLGMTRRALAMTRTRLAGTAQVNRAAASRKQAAVVSQPRQASVMETP